MDAMSFCAAENDEIIGYTGVVSWNTNIKNTAFKICGLSCVCTHPEHRSRGIGTALVRKATEWIMLCGSFDIGLFTCSHKNTPFYENIHPWKKSPDLTLKESDREGAYASNILHLDVFKLIISAKAGQHTDYFENTTINLNFPKGKFI